jgi:hypothetical protein
VGAKNADLFPNGAFPERSRRNAKRRCRNPDGDPGGPWCYVEVPGDEYWEEEKSDDEKHEKGAKKLKGFEEEENEEEEDEERFEREYCDVPFCDEKGKLEGLMEGSINLIHVLNLIKVLRKAVGPKAEGRRERTKLLYEF